MDGYANKKLYIGVLAIQGSFQEHQSALLKCTKQDFLAGIELNVITVSEAYHLNGLDGLVLPGGESTTIRKILNGKILEEFKKWAKDDQHVLFGTCAGLILLSKNIENQTTVDKANHFGIMDVTINRNYFGRQMNSFEGCVCIQDETIIKENERNNKPRPGTCSGVFIRAPAVTSIDGLNVKTLATIQLPGVEKDVIVGVKDKNCIGLAFHPELTEDLQWHIYFLKEVLKRKFKL